MSVQICYEDQIANNVLKVSFLPEIPMNEFKKLLDGWEWISQFSSKRWFDKCFLKAKKWTIKSHFFKSEGLSQAIEAWSMRNALQGCS